MADEPNNEGYDNLLQDQQIEYYCEDDSKDDIHEDVKKGSVKTFSIDDQISQLASGIQLEKEFELNLTPYHEKTNFQDKIDILITQMKEISEYINVKCAMIDKMNILMCILTFKIFDIQHEFNIQLEALKEKRESILLSKEDESTIPVELLDVDRIMRELQLCYHEKSKAYKEQNINTQLEYEKIITVLDDQLEIIKHNLGILSEEHESFLGDTNKSNPLLIDYVIQAAMEEYSNIVKQFELKQKNGWKSSNGDEEMLDILRSRGLAVSKSGNILTEDGEKLSYSEAENRKLLEGLDFRSKLFPAEKTKNEDIVSLSSSTQSSEPEKESLASHISTEDVSYLKETLGKPLTLALAEITAKQPRDPIHYLGHWLFKYRYNQELDITQKQEYEELMVERNRLLKEKLVS
ncbi:hypothetical protein WA026_021537 [Henosepilachna vigintioctopunctata]|uniref:Uncharacterized protein n=1 Tax=Henosepilachna vigintioctopunctata TaxID=420089 RepID=A0AAW1VBC7_9CUCU